MSWLLTIAAAALSFSVLAFCVWLWRGMFRPWNLTTAQASALLAGGAFAGLVAAIVEVVALQAAGLSIWAEPAGGSAEATPTALAMIVFCAPLEEALKVAVVWPFYVKRRLIKGRAAVTFALLSAGGFAAAETMAVIFVWDRTAWLDLLRAGMALPAHFFFAGLWGFMLGGATRERYFGLVWLACAVLHGLYAHLVFGRGPAFLVVAIPMFLTMGGGMYLLLRRREKDGTERLTTYSLLDPPSMGAVREAMSAKGRPLMIHWILFGALVTVGVTLAFLASAVYLGHRLDIDFSQVDQEGLAGVAPIALLGGALLAAFPFSAFLVARASGAVSVLEPAWATGAAIIVVLALFSVTEPTALVVALGVAPVGFTLACLGAWFGLDRR